MTAIRTQDMTNDRQRHLAALIEALLRHGLTCRLLGPDSSVLRVTGAGTERRVMVLVTPTSTGWSYLWSGDGIADAADLAGGARQIAQLLHPAGSTCAACDSATPPATPSPAAPAETPAPLATT